MNKISPTSQNDSPVVDNSSSVKFPRNHSTFRSIFNITNNFKRLQKVKRFGGDLTLELSTEKKSIKFPSDTLK